MLESSKLACGKPADLIAANQQTITESTSESTSEKTLYTHVEQTASFDELADKQEEKLLQEVFNYYISKTGRSQNAYLFTDKRKAKARLRMKELIRLKADTQDEAIADMKLAIDGLVASPFHMGKNDRNTKYIDFIDNLFKSWEEMEKRINFAVGNTHGR